MHTSIPSNAADYHVGIICALDSELAAVEGMLDDEHEIHIRKDVQDSNSYSFGRMHNHNIVIACLPAGTDGVTAAAIVAKDMIRTFPHLRFGLVVGIGGGIPNLDKSTDIRLGDVVVSHPTGVNGGVVQYDKGKSTTGGGWERKGTLNMPPPVLLTALQKLKAKHRRTRTKIPVYHSEMLTRYPDMEAEFSSPGFEKDALYRKEYDAITRKVTLGKLDAEYKVTRPPRHSADPKVHYGIIASGNQVVKDASLRDYLGEDCGAICVEMEAAGLMNQFPCLVIRGICDYADSHKNDEWHEYAAATAAAFAKELLLYVSSEDTAQSQPVQDLLDLLAKHGSASQEHYEDSREHYQASHEHYQDVREHQKRRELYYQDAEDQKCHQSFKTSPYEEYKNINEKPEDGTMKWVSGHTAFQNWQNGTSSDLLWISADPGCGKSVLSRWLIDTHLKQVNQAESVSICHFFFKDNETQSTLATALCALIHQLFVQQPRLLLHARSVWAKNGSTIQQEPTELWRIFRNAATDQNAEPIICVVDALDECKEGDRKRLIEMLAEFHSDIQATSNSVGNLKILATSRPYSNIEDDFRKQVSSLPSIHLRGEDEDEQMRREIDIVMRARLQKMSLPEQIKVRIEKKLESMQNRTYLWLHLALDCIPNILKRALSVDQEDFEDIPTTVDGAYEQILSRVDQRLHDRVRTILLIMIGASRPLAVDEMAVALGIALASRPPKSLSDVQVESEGLGEKIRQWCGLFVFVNDGRLYLLHQTAKEFLLQATHTPTKASGQWKHCLNQIDVNIQLSHMFMCYLCLDEFDQDWEDVIKPYKKDEDEATNLMIEHTPQLRFFLLAAEYWAYHWHHAEEYALEGHKQRLNTLYNTKSKRFENWITQAWKYGTGNFWNRFLHVESPEDDALRLASFLGHHTMLKQLLEEGCHDIESRDYIGWTAVIKAAFMGHLDVVNTLIENGANITAIANGKPAVFNRHFPNDALGLASYSGHEQIVQLLIDNGADVTASIQRYTALNAASHTNRGQILNILINAGVITKSDPEAVSNALVLALEVGYTDIAKLLICGGAAVDVPDAASATPLATASSFGRKDMVEFLIRSGADVNVVGSRYESALIAAAGDGYKDIVEILLEHGAEVDKAKQGHDTALVHATEGRHVDVVALLIKRNADVNREGPIRGRALEVAVRNSHLAMVELLLKQGADINLQDYRGHRPLKIAQDVLQHAQAGEWSPDNKDSSTAGLLNIISILRAHGAVEEITDVNEDTALLGTTARKRKREDRIDSDEGIIDDDRAAVPKAPRPLSLSSHVPEIRVSLIEDTVEIDLNEAIREAVAQTEKKPAAKYRHQEFVSRD